MLQKEMFTRTLTMCEKTECSPLNPEKWTFPSWHEDVTWYLYTFTS